METELRKQQVVEAKERMKMIKLSSGCREAFDLGEVWLSEGIGALYSLEEEQKKMVKDFEERNEAVVYHIIHNFFEFGECYSLFIVGKHKKEWKRDRKDLTEGISFVYVINKDEPSFSEFGTIGFRSSIGGLVRTA